MRKTTINTDHGSGIEEEIDKVIMFDFYSVIFNCKKKKTELRQFDIFDFMFHCRNIQFLLKDFSINVLRYGR